MDRIKQGKYQSREIFQSVWLYVILGIGIGAIIYGYVPADLIIRWAGPNNPVAVPFATMIRVPLYANMRVYYQLRKHW